ncbi:MAG: family 16 glycosylhydrolase [Bacteroidia bacterium]|nr:family 16 glycosylhydrolase [Bacteroidia bacterium]
MKSFKHINVVLLVALFVSACSTEEHHSDAITIQAIDTVRTSGNLQSSDQGVLLNEGDWTEYEVLVPRAGRYSVTLTASSKGGYLWVEDYVYNKDDRTYDITGKFHFTSNDQPIQIDGSPMDSGKHTIRVHCSAGYASLKKLQFELFQAYKNTPTVQQQNMEGDQWKLVWSDEFTGAGLPDTTIWSYNIGNWGWGNNELQYYTHGNLENARLENGNLIIQARKQDKKNTWTSARLTTQGKVSFLYGKIEFRAKVPTTRGTWSAGWLLGDAYRDEISWPYCGEIDVLECVGYEIDDSSGTGLNHATCHTRAYYFKQGNQIGSDTTLHHMNDSFHTYAIEWYPDVIYGLIDGKRYYTYDKNANELEWPFNEPQNLIVNLAIGGGWGGAKGLDEHLENPSYVLDYIRVYERQ